MHGRRSIIFRNDSGSDGDYALFMAFPHVYCEDSGAMHTAAWITRYVANRAHERIDLDDDVYAWYSSQEDSLSLGTVLESGVSQQATLGTKKTHGSSYMTSVRKGHDRLVKQPSAAPNGQFEIYAQPNPTGRELVGLGKRGDDGTIIPVAALEATPSHPYGIAPQPKFFLARFDSIKPGEIVDLRASWKKAAIDFSSSSSGKPHSQAVVTALPNGRFEVSYRTPASRPVAQRLASTPSVGALARHGMDKWSGSVTWPDTAPTSAVVQGSGMVVDVLSGKYRWSVNTSQTDEGGIRMKVRFWLREGRQPEYLYEEDWRAAVCGLLEQKEVGILDLGCFPATPYGSFSRLPVVSR